MAKDKIVLTGDRPTGRLHIGHYVGSLRQRPVSYTHLDVYKRQDLLRLQSLNKKV